MGKLHKNDLAFLPLGGSNEIGMNVNCYYHKGKWLIIDLGAGFADDYYPGVQMLAPDLEFIYNNLEDFVGIVLTHAHEDHVGSIAYLYDKLQLPIYATPFTAGVARHKLKEIQGGDEAVIHEIMPGKKFSVDVFDLEYVGITHSAPEMQGVVIRTEHGNVLHTGDWKFDPDPVVGDVSDIKRLKELGKEGILAMVCDSTNVFNDRFSGSEGDLFDSLTKLVKPAKEMVVLTTFASNVARLETLAKVAKACGRKVVLAGWSLKRITKIAKECGYLTEYDFLTDKQIKNHRKNELMVICTGCQGENNAQMAKVARREHPNITLTSGDLVIFSSKIIPGNEKTIFKLFNNLVRIGCDVMTEKDHFVHVSGHPSKEELREMYGYVKPKVAIPVHGEPTHLHEHARFAKECGVKHAVEIQNGELVRLGPNVESLRLEHSGYIAVDGNVLRPSEGEVMTARRKMQFSGVVHVSLAMQMGGGLFAEPIISAPGLLNTNTDEAFTQELKQHLIDVLESQSRFDNAFITEKVMKTLGKKIVKYTDKRPIIDVHIFRV